MPQTITTQLADVLSNHDIPVQAHPTTHDEALRLIEGAGAEPLPGTLDEIITAAIEECRDAAINEGYQPYIIQVRLANGAWSEEGCGDVTRYPTEEDAEDAIEALRALGGEWADAEYRVREEPWVPTPADCEYVQAQVLVALMTHEYEVLLDGGNGGETTLDADSLDEAIRQARDWADEGDWNTDEGSIWVSIEIRHHGEDVHHERYRIDPPEPECIEDEHDWQAPVEIVGGIEENPGVWGHGGGVFAHEVCIHCGITRITDTWAQDPETGEQGLESVQYNEDLHREAWMEWRDERDTEAIEEATSEWASDGPKRTTNYKGETYWRITVDAPDDEASEELLRAINAALPKGLAATWAGEGNTDADGESTEDIYIERA